MLRAQVLNSDAELNTFDVIGSLDFIAGSAFTLFIRLYQPQRKDLLRYVADTGATLVIHLPKKDGTTLDVTATGLVADLSMWHGDISADDSEDLVSGNFTFTLTEGMDVTLGLVDNGLALLTTGSCC